MIDLAALALACAPLVHVDTLAAVVRHESRGNPYAINVNDGPAVPQPTNRDEAIATAEKLLAAGRSADFGLGQISDKNLAWLGLSVADVFDPCKNLAAAQRVLTECYQRAAPVYGTGQPALVAALSCYNTGRFDRGITNGYVHKVAAQVPRLEPTAVPTAAPKPRSARDRMLSSPLTP